MFAVSTLLPSSGLMPDIAFFVEPRDEPCEFGEPPRRLLAAHLPAFANEFWRRIRRAVEAPVAIDESLGVRRVQVLGQVLYTRLPDGTFQVQAWRSPPQGPTTRQSVDPALIAVEHIPFRDRWLELFQEGFRFEIQRCTRAPADVLDEYTAWLFERIRFRVRHDCDIRAMRSKVRATIGFSPWHIRFASRVSPSRRPDGVVTVAAYNEFVRGWARLEED